MYYIVRREPATVQRQPLCAAVAQHSVHGLRLAVRQRIERRCEVTSTALIIININGVGFELGVERRCVARVCRGVRAARGVRCVRSGVRGGGSGGCCGHDQLV